MSLKSTPGPERTFTFCTEFTTPTIGGISVGVGVSEGVGEMVAVGGIGVKVGSGVRVETGVAVRRGVWLKIGASVAVGRLALVLLGAVAHALNRNNNRIAIEFNLGME